MTETLLAEQYARINVCIAHLEVGAAEALRRLSTSKTFRKGDFLLRGGDVCRYSFTVETGVVRKFYVAQHKEITTELIFADDIALSFGSYCLQRPSHDWIQAVTNTTVSVMDYTVFQQAKQAFPALVELDLLLTEYYAIWLEERLRVFHSLDATQRYALLLNKEPHIVQTVPLTYVASYLGVSLETLSRIRAKNFF